MLGKACLFQPGTKLLNGIHKSVGLLAFLEGGGINKLAAEGPHLADKGLHQHANGHTGWEGMRVDYQVGPVATIPMSETSMV